MQIAIGNRAIGASMIFSSIDDRENERNTHFQRENERNTDFQRENE